MHIYIYIYTYIYTCKSVKRDESYLSMIPKMIGKTAHFGA